jgi:hypothetical protein
MGSAKFAKTKGKMYIKTPILKEERESFFQTSKEK